jgi:ribulose 1,5-bisphosphate carboxylase large subunit-like protein
MNTSYKNGGGQPIDDAAANCPELATAIEKWGTETPR